MRRARGSLKCALTALALLLATSAWPAASASMPRDVLIDTSALVGVGASLAFDVIDGDGIANNTASVSSFLSDGVLGPGVSTGGVVGSLTPGPVTISDTDFFNELLQPVTLGTFIRFRVDVTGNNAGGSIPDAFSFFILDPAAAPLVTSDDPTGANALLQIDIVGGSAGSIATVFSAAAPSGAPVPVSITAQAVPLPGGHVLLTAGLLLLLFVSRALGLTSTRRHR